MKNRFSPPGGDETGTRKQDLLHHVEIMYRGFWGYSTEQSGRHNMGVGPKRYTNEIAWFIQATFQPVWMVNEEIKKAR